jgi:hypothetical protein
MFRMISWQQYAVFLVICLVVYYVVVMLRYFLVDIKRKLLKNGEPSQEDGSFFQATPYVAGPLLKPISSYQPEPEEIPNEEGSGLTEMNLLPLAHELSDEIKTLAEDAGKRKLVKEELIVAFQVILTKPPYNQLKESAFREASDEMILEEIQNNCSILLDPQELQHLWVK